MIEFISKEVTSIDLMNVTDAQLQELLIRLDHSEDKPEAIALRREPRACYRLPQRLLMLIDQPGGEAVLYLIVPRDISPHGMCFLHGQFLYPETRVVIKLPTIDDEALLGGGRVKRCRHVKGRIHEVGISFEYPIDLADFLPAELLAEPDRGVD